MKMASYDFKNRIHNNNLRNLKSGALDNGFL